MIEKIYYSFLVAVLIAAVVGVFLIIVGIKVKNILLPVVFVTDLILFFFYKNEILNYSTSNDIFYIFLYYTVSILFCLIYSIYLFISNRTGRCVCKRCREPDYEEIKDGNI